MLSVGKNVTFTLVWLPCPYVLWHRHKPWISSCFHRPSRYLFPHVTAHVVSKYRSLIAALGASWDLITEEGKEFFFLSGLPAPSVLATGESWHSNKKRKKRKRKKRWNGDSAGLATCLLKSRQTGGCSVAPDWGDYIENNVTMMEASASTHSKNSRAISPQSFDLNQHHLRLNLCKCLHGLTCRLSYISTSFTE